MRVAALLFLLTGGCLGSSSVVRVYDGRVVPGSFVAPEAYSAYLEGVLAEENGDLKGALAKYELAAREDDEDPEPLTKVGDLRCRIDPKSRAAGEAFANALRIDRAYAPALAARARCEAARGEPRAALETMARLGAEDRTSAAIEAVLVGLTAQREGDPAGRERAIALTLASDEPVAWDALVTWARAKGDAELVARGLENLVRAAPMRQGDVEKGALDLAGSGQVTLARRVAGAIADATTGATGPRDETVARLAIDDAILGDPAKIARRAVRGHVPLAEAAARALLLERGAVAVTLANEVRAADPSSGCAAMVLAAAAAREGKPFATKVRPADAPAPACTLAFAERLAAVQPDAARAWMVGTASPSPRDPVTSPIAVELAVRGVLAEATLPMELRLEVAAHRHGAPPPVDPDAVARMAPKHALLWYALAAPQSEPVRRLAERLAGAVERDPVVGFAVARVLPSEKVERALASAPPHPLTAIARHGRRPVN